ncbi:DUF6907 domain-containing protein [Streptomyces sp. SPB074]|uniref:DUF6907 domain-containing protein n=1 Tax=Streptomyces sp. (strain SPB074) TaxID=465543 RepID=UPI00017F25ED|nr:hypothetical protein [Streptomyces sp. SPB074]EDY44595.1 hypothetical protein SSBG_02557 [Streptomyces sp. SPB074]
MSAPRTVTVGILVRSLRRLTVPEPSWCLGHPEARHPEAQVDLTHEGSPVSLDLRVGDEEPQPFLTLTPLSHPYSSAEDRREPFVLVSVELDDSACSPAELLDLADQFAEHAAALRAWSRYFSTLLADGGSR